MTSQTVPDNVTSIKVRPKRISAAEHGISLSVISENSLKVLKRLNSAGYKSYLVGGCVRDLILGITPKDFDVVTEAKPEQIREIFRRCRIIGRRFRLAHVHFQDEIIEVSTFRAPHNGVSEHAHTRDGRIIRDNVYGEIDDDVWRRDFTVNALFFDVTGRTIMDYVGGMRDIARKDLRLIGDPVARYREDPVRMLRAIRFAAKLGFNIHPSAREPITDMKGLLGEISNARLFEEFVKLFTGGKATETFQQLLAFDLFQYLFPQTDEILKSEKDFSTVSLVKSVCLNTDKRIAEEKSITPAFIIAALLWHPVVRQMEKFQRQSVPVVESTHLASDAVFARQVSSLAIPRRYTRMTREIWNLQHRFNNTHGKKPFRLLAHPRFRAAYDFLLLREQSGEDIAELTQWWTDFQAEHHEKYKYRERPLHQHRRHYKKRRRRDPDRS